MKTGLFITLEGIEGAGKTTQMPLLVQFLEERGYSCVRTREPGGTGIGARLRAVLLDPACSGMDPLCELLLYQADRAQHVAEVIAPALARGKVVVCDRFADATVAYQGYGRNLGPEKVAALHAQVFGSLAPDLTLLFDLPAEVGLARARQRVAAEGECAEGRFEEEDIAFHKRVREGYLDLADKHPGRFVLVDADGDAQTVGARMIGAAKAFLETREAIPG